MIFIVFEYVLPKQKLLLIMRKCQKFPLKLVVKSALLAAILKNQLYFVSVVIQIFRIRSAVQHCTCNPLSQNTIAHNLLLCTVAMDGIICLGYQSHQAFFAFSSYFSQLLSANSSQYKSTQVELKMANSKWTYQGKN